MGDSSASGQQVAGSHRYHVEERSLPSTSRTLSVTVRNVSSPTAPCSAWRSTSVPSGRLRWG